MTTTGTIANDERCDACGAQPERRTCSGCDQSAMITDCGHQSQPRPIAAGRNDGSAMDRAFCAFCALDTQHQDPTEPPRTAADIPRDGLYRDDNTEGYTAQQRATLNAEFATRWLAGDWAGAGDAREAAGRFSDEVAARTDRA